MLLAYAALLVINLHDRPPAAETLALHALLEPASPVVSDDNSYLQMLGFAGPPDAGPLRLGLDRHQWMEQARPDFDRSADPLPDDYNFRAARSEKVSNLAQNCAESEAGCLRLLESDEETVAQWIADEGWLLDRYRSLINMTDFREAMPYEVLAPLPSYSVIAEGQRLHFADAWQSATTGDPATVQKLLDADLSFWRMVLENSDVLITKMLATTAVSRHFKLGNLVLRRLPHDVAAGGIPMSWRSSISDEEQSMKRCLAGEWLYFDKSSWNMGAPPDNPDVLPGLSDTETWDRLAWFLLKPFWQPQDLSNRYARLMFDLGETFSVPYDDVPSAVGLADDLREAAFRPFSRPYNLLGDLLMSANIGSFSGYAVRVSDLEGIRRAALLAAELRAQEIHESEIVPRIIASDIVDPYTSAPFTWQDESGTIVFNGLEPNVRSHHEIIY